MTARCTGTGCKRSGIWPIEHAIMGTIWYCAECFFVRYGKHPASPKKTIQVIEPAVFENKDEPLYGDRRDMPDVTINRHGGKRHEH